MPLLTKECLDKLRDRVNLLEIVSSHIDIKHIGAKRKALCPFHKEKTPSFTVNPGDSHYHCFGCGAHGDAIAFLMNFLGITFNEAVEYLADKYHIQLDYTGKKEKKFEYKRDLFTINQKIMEFFHFHLLHSKEGKPILEYLFKRGISENFIKKFRIGYAPKDEFLQKAFFKSESFSEKFLVLSGIISDSTKRPFFNERIMFPVHDGVGNVIAFSGRKIDERVFGGKYINTKETQIFKKSKILYGLNYSRRNIAKDGRVIVVEGQIDALRLIFEGFEYVVASQGTAFGEDHVQELIKVGVNEVNLCFDGDSAGDKTAIKVGQLFQKEGVEVFVCNFPNGIDPDSYILENGKESFEKLLKNRKDYLTFLIGNHSKDGKAKTPAGKNALAIEIKKMIAEWKHPIMQHEGEKVLFRLLNIPNKYLSEKKVDIEHKKASRIVDKVDSLEEDLIRWLLLIHDEELKKIIMDNITIDFIYDPTIKMIFSCMQELYNENKKIELLSLGVSLDDKMIKITEDLKAKRMNLLRAREGIVLLCKKIIERHWAIKCDGIRNKIQSGKLSYVLYQLFFR